MPSMDSTHIRVRPSTKLRIQRVRLIERETMDSTITRALDALEAVQPPKPHRVVRRAIAGKNEASRASQEK